MYRHCSATRPVGLEEDLNHVIVPVAEANRQPAAGRLPLTYDRNL